MSIEAKLSALKFLQEKIEEFMPTILEERELRKDIAMELTKGLAVGTHKFTFKGLAVKVQTGFDYKVDQEIKLSFDDLTDEEIDCLRIKYELDLRKYKALENSELLDEFITVKDSMPSIEIESM